MLNRVARPSKKSVDLELLVPPFVSPLHHLAQSLELTLVQNQLEVGKEELTAI